MEEKEDRLGRLLDKSSEENRAKVAAEWKRQGKLIIGTVDANTPEELIYAAGMLPWRITGTRQESTPLAHSHRSRGTDVYCNHLLESLLMGELDFLDGIVIGCEDDDLRRLYDNWKHIGKTPFIYLLYAPHKDSGIIRNLFAETITKLMRELEQFASVKISEDALRNAIQVYNKWRTLLMRLYELRKREVPPLSGSEFLKLVTASFAMPKNEFNQELEALFPYLEQRKTSLKTVWPRLLISSDKLDNPDYLELIESIGSLIAMDDLDTGSRYFWGTTGLNQDPVAALAERYTSRPPCSHTVQWDRYVGQIIAWTKEYNISGVLNLSHMYGYVRQIITPYFRDKLTQAGIPIMSLNIEYHLANVEQLRTRIGAFVESLVASRKG